MIGITPSSATRPIPCQHDHSGPAVPRSVASRRLAQTAVTSATAATACERSSRRRKSALAVHTRGGRGHGGLRSALSAARPSCGLPELVDHPYGTTTFAGGWFPTVWIDHPATDPWGGRADGVPLRPGHDVHTAGCRRLLTDTSSIPTPFTGQAAMAQGRWTGPRPGSALLDSVVNSGYASPLLEWSKNPLEGRSGIPTADGSTYYEGPAAFPCHGAQVR